MCTIGCLPPLIFIPLRVVHFQLNVSGNQVDYNKGPPKVICTLWKIVRRKYRDNDGTDIIVSRVEERTNELKFCECDRKCQTMTPTLSPSLHCL